MRHLGVLALVLLPGLLIAGCPPIVPPVAEPGEVITMPVPSAAGPGEPCVPRYSTVSAYSTAVARSNDPVDVYFPNRPAAEGNLLLPVVVLLQGFNVDKAFYSGFAAGVAAHGFIVVVPNHRDPLGLGLFAEARELDEVRAFVAAEYADPDSPLTGVVDTGTVALVGHSLGGAVALNVARAAGPSALCSGGPARPAEPSAVVVYGSSWVTPLACDSTPPIATGGLPVMLIGGDLDSIAPPDGVAEVFDSLRDPPRAVVTVHGANHFGIADINNPPGTVVDRNTPTIPQDEAVATIAHWTALFLRAYTRADNDALTCLREAGDDNATVVFEE